MKISSKRAEYIAVVALILGLVFFITALLLGRWSGFFAVFAAAWLILSAALIWFVLVIQFHQRALAEQEKLDISQNPSDEHTSDIFQAETEQAGLFSVDQRRLEMLEKWFLPIFSAFIAAYQIGIGLYLLKTIPQQTQFHTQQPLICAVAMTAVAFVSFLISRYATGMAVLIQWKPLRAGGSSFLSITVVCFALAVSLALTQFKFPVPLHVIDYVIPILLLILGLETGLNVVLDLYRPRLKGRYSRSAFDSRLLGIINEPGGIFHTAASTIDYQFGFKVSQTWFYKLLEKAVVPLTLFASVILYLMSAIVVVQPHEQAIIEHFGNPFTDADQVRLIGPGLTFKWPWPIDKIRKYPSKKISEISIGFLPEVKPEAEKVGYGPLLWGMQHYKEEYKLLVASAHTSALSAEGSVPVSLVMVAAPVQYKVKDLYAFLYNHRQPEKCLEAICYRELTKFAAGATIEVDDPNQIQRSLLGAGRTLAKQTLTEQIQKAADKTGLGVEIVFVGLQGIHPPSQVASDYQKVVGAVQKKQAHILDAHARRNKTLISIAGSVEQADRLYNLAAQFQHIRNKSQPAQVEKLARQLDQAFARAKGDIFKTLTQAQSYAFEKATLAEATGRRFAGQLKAYRAAKDFYTREQRLAVLEEALENIRKYVVVADHNDFQVYIVDLKEKLTPSLYDLAGIEEKSKK